jgi:hypothetical protein
MYDAYEQGDGVDAFNVVNPLIGVANLALAIEDDDEYEITRQSVAMGGTLILGVIVGKVLGGKTGAGKGGKTTRGPPGGGAGIGAAKALRPEAKYLRGAKHGLQWTEGPAEALKTGKPQGQWGSKADLDFAAEKAAMLKTGEGGYFDLPPGSKSVVHRPDGTTVPATRIWVRNNGTGTFHGAPWE